MSAVEVGGGRRGEQRREREGCWKGRDRRSEGDQQGGGEVCVCVTVCVWGGVREEGSGE